MEACRSYWGTTNDSWRVGRSVGERTVMDSPEAWKPRVQWILCIYIPGAQVFKQDKIVPNGSLFLRLHYGESSVELQCMSLTRKKSVFALERRKRIHIRSPDSCYLLLISFKCRSNYVTLLFVWKQNICCHGTAIFLSRERDAWASAKTGGWKEMRFNSLSKHR